MIDRADPDRLRELLERYEQMIGRLERPIMEFLAPGLPEDAIDAATARIRLRLPVEARVWYQWHDGTTAAPLNYPDRRRTIGIRDYELLSLDQAIATYENNRATVARHDTPRWPADEQYHPSWFPLLQADNGDMLIVDCDVPDGAPTPVRRFGWDDEARHEIRSPSLARTVEVWVMMYERGFAIRAATPPGEPIPRYRHEEWMYLTGAF